MYRGQLPWRSHAYALWPAAPAKPGLLGTPYRASNTCVRSSHLSGGYSSLHQFSFPSHCLRPDGIETNHFGHALFTFFAHRIYGSIKICYFMPLNLEWFVTEQQQYLEHNFEENAVVLQWFSLNSFSLCEFFKYYVSQYITLHFFFTRVACHCSLT